MVTGDNTLATQCTVIFIIYMFLLIIPRMTLPVPLDVVPGDEFLATQITVIWIFKSINLHVLFYVFSEAEFLATQSTGIYNDPSCVLSPYMVP